MDTPIGVIRQYTGKMLTMDEINKELERKGVREHVLRTEYDSTREVGKVILSPKCRTKRG